jgi:hypothetical protein
MSRALILLAGTEHLRLYTACPGEPVPLFVKHFDAEEPLPVVTGETPDLLGAVQDDRAQAFLLDHLVVPALPASGPAMLTRFFEQVHAELQSAGYLDRALESLIIVPPPLADPDRCASVAALVGEVFGIPARCCVHKDALAAGLWASGALREPSLEHPTWVQIAAAHHTLFMRLRSSPGPALEAVARLDQGGRSVDQRLASSLSEALGRSRQSAQAAVVVLAARTAKEQLCGGSQRVAGSLEHWVSLQLDGEYWEGEFTTDMERFQAPGSAGPALDRMMGFVERAYHQLGLTPLDPEHPRPQLVVCGRGNLLPGLRRLRRGLAAEEPGAGVHLVELLADADLLARGAALAEGLCHLDGGFQGWPLPPPLEREGVAEEPTDGDLLVNGPEHDQGKPQPVDCDPQVIDIEPEDPELSPERDSVVAEPTVTEEASTDADPGGALSGLVGRLRETLIRDETPTSSPPPGRCRSCSSSTLEWVFLCRRCNKIAVARPGQQHRLCETCRGVMQLTRRCIACGSIC